MKIVVNGETVEADAGTTLADLIVARGLGGKPVAVERNASLVPRERHAQIELADGDEIEIVTFVGGG